MNEPLQTLCNFSRSLLGLPKQGLQYSAIELIRVHLGVDVSVYRSVKLRIVTVLFSLLYNIFTNIANSVIIKLQKA